MFDEGFRLLMEFMDFEPVAEPTERQRKFFSDTAYADDELQLRRTILARICTFDTSVKDPTDEQLEEAVEFLESVLEAGVPQNEWEQRAVTRIRDVVRKAVGAPRVEGEGEKSPEDKGTVQAAVGGGDAGEDEPEDGVDHLQDVYAQQLQETEDELSGMDLSKTEAFSNGAQPPAQQPPAQQPPAQQPPAQQPPAQQVRVDYSRSSGLPVADEELGTGTGGLLGELGVKRGPTALDVRNGTDPRNPAELENLIQEDNHWIRDAAVRRGGSPMKLPGMPGAWSGETKRVGPQTRWGPGEKRPR